jgi:hypothetical protein
MDQQIKINDTETSLTNLLQISSYFNTYVERENQYPHPFRHEAKVLFNCYIDLSLTITHLQEEIKTLQQKIYDTPKM